jgi:hypothetical protein
MALSLSRHDPGVRTAAARTRRRPRSRAALVEAPQGTLLLDRGPAWRKGSLWTLLVRAWQVLFILGVLALVAGPAGSMVAFVGVLWLSPWLGLLAADSRLVQRIRTGRQLLRRGRLRRAAHRRLRGMPLRVGALGPPGAGWRRVRGRVLDGAGFASAGGRQGCVLAHYAGLVGEAGDREPQVELHAVPSFLLVVGDEIVEVALADARYVERPVSVEVARGADAVQHEQTVAAGDEIEVLGYLGRQIDQSTGAYRTPGLKLVMGGDGQQPLVVCWPERRG